MEDVKNFDKFQLNRDTGKFDAVHGEPITQMHPALYGKMHRAENCPKLTGLSAVNYLKGNNESTPSSIMKHGDDHQSINKYAKIDEYLKKIADEQKMDVLKHVRVKRSHLYGKTEN